MLWSAQGLVVACIVGACALFALWTLAPSAARRACATAALRLPLPAGLAARLRPAIRAAAQGESGCCCAGCEHAAPKENAAASVEQRVTFHPPLRR
jgi:hypothetical protein